ncbi:hypothetical protein QTP88_006033 [Uroleucon formosanum]
MTCSNATGSQKLKLVVIGNSKKPRSFKGTRAENLPVHYFNQKKAWMNQEIFKEWFEKKCLPQVREHLKSQNLPQKAVLLIDNASSHPVDLKSEYGNIFVKFLPPNVTALIQPMDQGVIASMKKNYRTSLLKKRIEEGNDLKSFWKDYTILDSIYDINTAWGNINEWINCDANDPGVERLSDEQIVSGALGTVLESEGEEEENDEVNEVKQQKFYQTLQSLIVADHYGRGRKDSSGNPWSTLHAEFVSFGVLLTWNNIQEVRPLIPYLRYRPQPTYDVGSVENENLVNTTVRQRSQSRQSLL